MTTSPCACGNGQQLPLPRCARRNAPRRLVDGATQFFVGQIAKTGILLPAAAPSSSADAQAVHGFW
jgi:hypothetical protein